MSVGQQLIIKLLQKIKLQLPTITDEDIIVALNIAYMCCSEYRDIIGAVNHIAEYYKQQDDKFDEEVFSACFHHALQFIDEEILTKLRTLISDISIYNIFNHPLLLNDFHEFVKIGNINNTSFLREKIKLMKNDNIYFIKKINSCIDLNKLKEEINNNLNIFKHLKSVCENYRVCVLNAHNFVASRTKCLFINDDTDNSIVLVGSDYDKIKEIISREDRFKEILIVDSSKPEPAYKLNIEALNIIFREQISKLLAEYELKTFDFKESKSKMIDLKIKGIKLKVQNIFDLSKVIFDIFDKSVELLPLTKVINEVFNKLGPKIYLSKIVKEIDDNIKILEKLNEKAEEILSNNVKKEELVPVAVISNKKRKKKKKENPRNDNLKSVKLNSSDSNTMQVHTANISEVNHLVEEVTEMEEKSFDVHIINVAEQVITENNVKVILPEEFKQDESLKTKINELEIRLNQMTEELNQTKIKSATETAILKQELIAEKQKVQILSDETELLVAKVTDLENEKIKLENIKQQNSKKINIISSDLEKVQKKLKNVRDKKNKSLEKLREKKSDLVLEKQKLETINEKNSQQLTKLNQELVKTQQTLQTLENKNHQLLSEVNELKQEKINLENAQHENNNQIKVKKESIALLEKKLATIDKQKNTEVHKLIKQRNRLIFEKQNLESANKINHQQLITLVEQLNKKQQTLQYNSDEIGFFNSYNVSACVQVSPVFEQQQVLKEVIVNEVQEQQAIVPILVPTGKQFLIQAEMVEDVYIGDEATHGFCLQPKPFI